MSIKELGEFGFIESIKRYFSEMNLGSIEGIGDDCAVIPIDNCYSFVVSTDMLIENSHFLRKKISPYLLGRKSLAVNLSDIAAMGAEPFASFLSIGIDPNIDKQWCDEFIRGYHELSKSHNTPLLGGDTTASTIGITINVTVIGKIANEKIKRRSGAKSGDLIAITNQIGDSAAGLKILLNEIEIDNDDKKYLIEQHHNPTPKIAEGLWLSSQKAVTSMMDISDGVASDLRHICNASKLSANIFTSKIPLSEPLKHICETYKWDTAQLSLCSGEDYSLLFTISANESDNIATAYQDYFGKELFIIGEMTDKKEECIIGIDANGNSTIIGNGFSHF